MKLRIPDYICLFDEGRQEFYNDKMDTALRGDGALVELKMENGSVYSYDCDSIPLVFWDAERYLRHGILPDMTGF